MATGNGLVEIQNKALTKRIQIAQEEGKNWRDELLVYLFAYRTTPHSTTGISPAEALFGRKLRTKFPEIRSTALLDEEIRDKDQLQKIKGKEYADFKRRAKESKIEVGDDVLVQRTGGNKFQTPFIPTPFKVLGKVNGNCEIQSPEGIRYGRNVTFLKKFQRSDNEAEDKNMESTDDLISEPEEEHDHEEGNKVEQGLQSEPKGKESRPVRLKTVPEHLKDYVLTLRGEGL